MSSSICQHFTQNAWKKDLCSNCFKSRDEHRQAAATSAGSSMAARFTSALSAHTKFGISAAHANTAATLQSNGGVKKPADYLNKQRAPARSIMKRKASAAAGTARSGGKAQPHHKVCFSKALSEVIGYGGDWSGAESDDDDDDHDFMNLANERADDLAATGTDDEDTLELKRVTRANTDFNMNNGNLLGDAQDNIKKSFAALKLGAPQVDKEGKKQTLKINVVPFGAAPPEPTPATATLSVAKQRSGAPIATNAAKAKFEAKPEPGVAAAAVVVVGKAAVLASKQTATVVRSMKKSTTTATTMTTTASCTTTTVVAKRKEECSDSDGKNSPPIERAMEKSLMDEISETLEQKQSESKKLAAQKVDEVQSAVAASATTPQAPTTPTSPTSPGGKIKFAITSLSEALEHSNKPFLELKKPIARNTPITREHAKPKVTVVAAASGAHKYSDTDSNSSDNDNSISAYYDVVETQLSYENLPDGKCSAAPAKQPTAKIAATPATKLSGQAKVSSEAAPMPAATPTDSQKKALYSSSQYITDMLLSSKTRAASYNLHEGNFMTSQITTDGLIVTKCSSDDALDSTGSSFDGSSDEETSYNMTRSESDSGIGISIGSSDYKNLQAAAAVGVAAAAAAAAAATATSAAATEKERLRVAKKLSASTSNSDYEDILVTDARGAAPGSKTATPGSAYSLEKCRELHGEPDGSADPDGRLEATKETKETAQLPALPKSPPPTKIIDARPSFLHGLQKTHPSIVLKKPDLPAKPTMAPPAVNTLKTFGAGKRQPSSVEQQVISQLQLVMSKSSEQINAAGLDNDAKLRKGRAPNPPPEPKSSAPPTPERDYSLVVELETPEQPPSVAQSPQPPAESKAAAESAVAGNANSGTGMPSASSIYTRKPLPSTVGVASGSSLKAAANVSPVIRERDKRERAIINPKFRSLNTFVQRSSAAKQLQLQNPSTSSLSLKQGPPLTPEPMPRGGVKCLSMSEECLSEAAYSVGSLAGGEGKKCAGSPTKPKSKFSIKKFLRMGASKTTDQLHKKDGVYSEICTGDDGSVLGRPRLVIIHPIDINPAAVEVVKDITKTGDAVKAQTVAVVTAKPPAPPLRATADAQRAAHESSKPARPPPPKSAEMRRKQKVSLSAGSSVVDGPSGGSIKCKADNVYANLGEIRSAIAPRKPERTASMREREAQLELARKRHGHDNADTISICSSNGDIVSEQQQQQQQQQQQHYSTNPNGGATINNNNNKHNNNTNYSNTTLSPQLSRCTTPQSLNESLGSGAGGVGSKPPSGSRTSTFERQKKCEANKIATKLEIFEQRNSSGNGGGSESGSRPSSLKDSVRKINSTIDSYLKDKRDYENMYEFVKMPTTAGAATTTTAPSAASTPPPPPARNMEPATLASSGGAAMPPTVVGQQARMLLPVARQGTRGQPLYADNISLASYTRSEYAPVRNYGLHGSLANIPRVISASYCGSEMGDLDIYAPYSYYGSEAGGDLANDINDSVWGIPAAIKNRSGGKATTNRLRLRKGRSVVHKTIEDNYTAVVVANHEALAQVLDQLQQTPVIPAALRPLANAINLRFEDFAVLDGAQAFVVGKKAFHAAVWTSAPVTLALSADCGQLAGVGGGGELSQQLSGGVSGVLNAITEFCDLVPSYHLPLMPSTEVQLLQATIAVLPRLQLDTLQSIGAILKGKSQLLERSNYNFRGSIPNLAAGGGLKDGSGVLRNVVSVQNLCTLSEECVLPLEQQSSAGGDELETSSAGGGGMPAFDDVMTREVAFIMLQLVNGMKNLQGKAIEEMPLSLSNVVLSKDVENKDAQARLCVLQGNNNDEDEPMGTLCRCAHVALVELLPATKISALLADILLQERAESLSKAKAVLEFILWGPSDVVLAGATKERELALQRWLDLERATVLHGLVRTRVELTVYDECHLMFLVRSTAKMMNDAAKIVCSYQTAPLTVAANEQQQH